MIPSVLVIICFGITVVYLVIFSALNIALFRRKDSEKDSLLSPAKSVSLIVPFRNELRNLPHIIDDLARQHYPRELLHVLFVNDHSEDGSDKYVENVCKEMSNYRLINLPKGESGKKLALHRGICETVTDWIIQTDADCRLPEEFIGGHMKYAVREDVDLIAGPVLLQADGKFWNRIEALEQMSLSATGLASFILKRPVLCNGANLSYRKKFYTEVSDKLISVPSASGDDIFLLEQAKKAGKNLVFLEEKKYLVTTGTAGGFLPFIRQRIRWASKSVYYKDPDIIVLALAVWSANAVILTFLILSFFNRTFLGFFLMILGIKSVPDLLLLYRMAQRYDRMNLLLVYPAAAVIYYIYSVITGLFSLTGVFYWKKRKYRKHSAGKRRGLAP